MLGAYLQFKGFFVSMSLMQDMENEVKESGSDKQVYELGYLLVPTLGEEDFANVYGSIKDLVSSFDGEYIADEMPKMIPLAYQMVKVVSNIRNKYTDGYFGWIKFYMDKDKVGDLKKKLDFDPNVIRFLILKTVKENTIASKRFIGKDSAYRKNAHKKDENVEATPMNTEEVDKEIEAMIGA